MSDNSPQLSPPPLVIFKVARPPKLSQDYFSQRKNSISLPRYSFSCIDVQNIIIKYRLFGLVELQKKIGIASSLSPSSCGIIFLPRPSIIAIEHYLLAAFRPHVTFAT